MSNSWGRLRRRFLGIPAREATFAERGFVSGDAGARRRLEQSAATFLHGYHAGLETTDLSALAARLNAVEAEFRGFAFEGAAMALALLDHLTPWNGSRWHTFVRGPGAAHVYMVHLGAGWAAARLPWLRRQVQRALRPLDPLLRWLAMDGFGFHEGFFDWRRSIQAKARPARLGGYAARAFDQGLGRSLWFVSGADVVRIDLTIAAFPRARRADLWSGVGLACAYAGGVDRRTLEALVEASGPYGPPLAQGAAFAAKARQRAGNPAPHTDQACGVFCRMSADAAAEITDVSLGALPGDGPEPAYEVWRRRIQAQFATQEEVPR